MYYVSTFFRHHLIQMLVILSLFQRPIYLPSKCLTTSLWNIWKCIIIKSIGRKGAFFNWLFEQSPGVFYCTWFECLHSNRAALGISRIVEVASLCAEIKMKLFFCVCGCFVLSYSLLLLVPELECCVSFSACVFPSSLIFFCSSNDTFTQGHSDWNSFGLNSLSWQQPISAPQLWQ